MWLNGNQIKPNGAAFNNQLLNLKGDLEEREAKISLAQFLHHNIGLATELLLGLKLFPYQEMMLRAWFKRNNTLAVLARGGAKSYLASIFCCLYPLFYPMARIVIVSSNFRTARRIFEQAQKFVNSKQAILLILNCS